MYFTTTTKGVVGVQAYKSFKIKTETKIQVTFLFVWGQTYLLKTYLNPLKYEYNRLNLKVG